MLGLEKKKDVETFSHYLFSLHVRHISNGERKTDCAVLFETAVKPSAICALCWSVNHALYRFGNAGGTPEFFCFYRIEFPYAFIIRDSRGITFAFGVALKSFQLGELVVTMRPKGTLQNVG